MRKIEDFDVAAVRARAEARLLEVNYNICHYTEETYIHWVESWRKRELLLEAWETPPTLFGGWLTSSECKVDFVFYKKGLSSHKKKLVLFHETGHMFCRHPEPEIDIIEAQILFKALNQGQASSYKLPINSMLLRSTYCNEMELEAEGLLNRECSS